MRHIRKDYVFDKFMIINPTKKNSENTPTTKKSVYAPGNESKTNLSVLSLVAKDGMLQRLQDNDDERVLDWSIRVFERGDPIVSIDCGNTYSDVPYYSEPAYGYHYIVVATPNTNDTFATLDIDQWSNILVVVQDRMRWLYTQKGVTYVAIYADHGIVAGNTNPHPHLNLVTFSTIPPVIEKEAQASHKISNEKGICSMCQVVGDENNTSREIIQTEGFVAFSPWTTTQPFEFWIVPKKHNTSFVKITQKEINDLSLILRATLGGLTKTIKNVSYSIVFHLSPEKKNSKQIHWHIRVYPITKPWSGLERGYGVFLSDVSPEDVATKLGTACRKEFGSIVGIV